MRDLGERHAVVKAQRGREAAWSMFATICTAELLFASFAIGASYGPGPFRPVELVAGFTASFLIGSAVALPLARRRLDHDAVLYARVREGRSDRRLTVHRSYLVIDGEIVLFGAVETVTLEGSQLMLRYIDARYGGAMLRELAGDRTTLEKVAALLPKRTPA